MGYVPHKGDQCAWRVRCARAELLRVLRDREAVLIREKEAWLDEHFALIWRLALGEVLTDEEQTRLAHLTDRARAMTEWPKRLPADILATIQELRLLRQ